MFGTGCRYLYGRMNDLGAVNSSLTFFANAEGWVEVMGIGKGVRKSPAALTSNTSFPKF